MIRLRCLLFITLSTTALSGLADMFVDRSIVVFDPDSQPKQDVKVRNTGTDNIYVQVDVLAVSRPGEDDEVREKVSDPKLLTLIATPNKLVVPPGGQKLVRIVNLQASNDVERIYRINVTPIVPPLDDENSQLRIVVAYQILTIILPNLPDSKLEVARDGKQITFSNKGNANILFSDGIQCKADDPNTCEELTTKRLYAGNTWTLPLPFDAPVSFSIRDFEGIKKQVFP